MTALRVAARSGATSRVAALLVVAAGLLAVALVGNAAGAQVPVRDTVRARDSIAALSRDSLKRDSLAARLAKLEEDVALLRRQLADEARMATRTRSRLGLVLTARVQTNVFLNSDRTNSVDVPQFVLAPPAAPNPLGSPGTRSLGMSVRQSRLGAAVSVDSVLGAQFEGDIDLDFFGGVSSGPGDRRLFPELRLRTARATMRWQRTELLVGSETPLVSDLNPISFAAVGIPGFVGAGNLWNWIPQIRLSRDVLAIGGESGVRIGLQGALLSPFSNAQHIAEPDAVDAGERSGRPFVESRVRIRWGSHDDGSDGAMGTGGEIGIGAHGGWLRASGPGLQYSRAFAADARFTIVRGVEVRGEAYRGALLRGLGGGGIAQNFGRALTGETLGPALRDVAGWAQLNVTPHPTTIAGVGCGFDRVDADDRPVRQRNGVCAVHAVFRPMQPVFLALEFRRLATRYADMTYRSGHFNLALGFEL